MIMDEATDLKYMLQHFFLRLAYCIARENRNSWVDFVIILDRDSQILQKTEKYMKMHTISMHSETVSTVQ